MTLGVKIGASLACDFQCSYYYYLVVPTTLLYLSRYIVGGAKQVRSLLLRSPLRSFKSVVVAKNVTMLHWSR